jgi:hypothetical protein
MLGENLDFPEEGFERMEILKTITHPDNWKEYSFKEKCIYVAGMYRGYYQGKREQAQETIDRFTQAIVGFKP